MVGWIEAMHFPGWMILNKKEADNVDNVMV